MTASIQAAVFSKLTLTDPTTRMDAQVDGAVNLNLASSSGLQDLTVQVSTASGSTVLSVPLGAVQPLYNVTALYISSVLGGVILYAVGG